MLRPMLARPLSNGMGSGSGDSRLKLRMGGSLPSGRVRGEAERFSEAQLRLTAAEDSIEHSPGTSAAHVARAFNVAAEPTCGEKCAVAIEAQVTGLTFASLGS
jgi:hypothetical protein